MANHYNEAIMEALRRRAAGLVRRFLKQGLVSDMGKEVGTVYNPCEDTSENAWEKGVAQGETSAMMRVIHNLVRAGKDMETIKIATGWMEEQIVRVVQPLMY